MRVALAATAASVVPAAIFLAPQGAPAQRSTAARLGTFSAPFVEPTVGPGYGYPRVKTTHRCVDRKTGQKGNPSEQPGLTHGFIDCKPTAGALNVIPGGKIVYWDNLAGTENVELSIGSEYGVVGLNDQSRMMDPLRKTWKDPTPVDGGARSHAKIEPLVPSELFRTHENKNDGSLFCADQNWLPDGRLLASGGTKYTNDPGNDASKFGSTELYGIENARIYDPKRNTWTQTGSMHKPRWYETMVTLGTGKEFVASGLRKLVKPINRNGHAPPPGHPTDGFATGYGFQDGQNEVNTETFDPNKWAPGVNRKKIAKGRWYLNPKSAQKSLPLFPRMHLLPNGHVFYDTQGQSFSPEGQAATEALWNIASSYNPKTQRWHDLGIPGLGVPGVLPGFRGSTFSVMLPLRPDANRRYTQASFLNAGGVPNPPSPGGYFAVRNSDIRTVDTANNEKLTDRPTGDMLQSSTPASGRWYGQGTLLPDGEVLATSGADRDEVVDPGSDIPDRRAELFNPNAIDPVTKRRGVWRPAATAARSRTYHNTAVLLPDASVLVGGHAIISNSYTRNFTFPGGKTDPNGEGRDPTFEIYKPPYLYCPGKQAAVTGATVGGPGRRRVEVTVNVPARSIDSVALVRYTSTTHVQDGDQREVIMPIISRRGNTLTVAAPTNGNVLPGGPYMLFANQKVGSCIKPSVSKTVFVGSAGHLNLRATQVRAPGFTG